MPGYEAHLLRSAMNDREKYFQSCGTPKHLPRRIGKARKKPGPVAKYRAKRRRAEGPVAKRVRARCVERDGYCRICDWENNPSDTHEGDDDFDSLPYAEDEWSRGPSEWAHLNEGKRAKTRGMTPEQRHSTAKSLMLCQFHHDHLDGRRQPQIEIDERNYLGADGPLDISTI